MRSFAFFTLLICVVLSSCKDDEDRCDDLTCFNGGVCVDGICDCPLGFSGFNCEEASPCDTIVCENNAPCVLGVCACPPGYSGPTCADFDPCFDTECQNGGTCEDGLCDCPPNYEGNLCEDQIEPTSITVTAVQVSQFPLLNNNGETWDQMLYPDIYPEVSKDGIVLYTAASPFVNAAPGSIYAWTPANTFTLDEVTDIHVFKLFDADPSGPELMRKVYFTPYNASNSFPDVLEFSSDSLSFSLQVEYTW